MQTRTSNVIPFPMDAALQGRTDRQRARFHAVALDHEVERLASGRFWSPGEWAREAAVPIVRTECIASYLSTALVRSVQSGQTRQRRRQIRRVHQAERKLRSSLARTAGSLAQLSDPSIGSAERTALLQDLMDLGGQRQRILEGLYKWTVRKARGTSLA